MIIVVIVALVLAIVVLIELNISIQKKLNAFKNINQKINNLTVLQDFMTIAGEEESVDEKLKKINEVIIEKYDIKYSTIVVFNGAEYVVKASNVDERHHETLSNLHTEEIFQDSVATATPKYITIDSENEKLPYQKFEMGRAKSAMFFPLYIDNIYIGYWIMESGQMHAFDKTDTTIIEVVKDNIVSVLQTTSYQETIENIDRIDQFTGLHSAEYLYGNAKRIFSKYPTSAVCMFRIMNIEEINKQVNREMGNDMITEISNIIKSKMASQYVFVRYMGPKFVIAFSGVEISGVAEYINDLKEKIENTKITLEEDEKIGAYPRLNFAISTYYKGTGLEEILKKQEEYLDNCDSNESDITNI